ncbi:C-type lectin domain family 4 member G [Fundulus heteroclitus]|uniref:C-type lectin domain family 4 member G n=1 Tax=Fundulus heteroclitus TaxID=8078 RepID=UPI00165A4AB6|nr:C-type lectin domain family 4 member G [Fundulus heteroclitus]
MERKAQNLDGSSDNPTVSSSAGHKFPSFSKLFLLLAAYWLILLVVIPLHIHFHLITRFELKQLKVKETLLLEENQNLTRELDEVKNKIQKLQKEKKNLTEQIETMEKPWNEQNVSRAQWSVNEYCPKEKNRKCSSCQKGWYHSWSSCYAVNYAEPPNQKTWDEAREDCRGKSSDLTVVSNEEEKMFVKENSWTDTIIRGYWIGLRAEGGKWRWIDGSDLTNQTWIQQQPVDGQCVTSLRNREWRSVSCDEKNGWICEKKALSV